MSELPADDRARRLREFGPLGIAAMAVIVLLGPILEPLGALLALAWARLSRTPWSAIGFSRPRSWTGAIAAGLALGVAFKLFMKAVVMPLLGAPDVNAVYHYLAGNSAALPGMMFQVVVGAAFGEEVVYRGYLFERLGKLIGAGRGARVAIVILTSALFGLVHYPVQGPAGAEQAVVTGLVFGSIYAATGRLWTVMVAHAAFDVTAVLIIYWDVETAVAHLLFA